MTRKTNAGGAAARARTALKRAWAGIIEDKPLDEILTDVKDAGSAIAETTRDGYNRGIEIVAETLEKHELKQGSTAEQASGVRQFITRHFSLGQAANSNASSADAPKPREPGNEG